MEKTKTEYRNNEIDLYQIRRTFSRDKGLTCGVGVNDADYVVEVKKFDENGNRYNLWNCPIYKQWKAMLRRAYTPEEKYKSAYLGVTVCDEWHIFSKFRKWYLQQNPPKGWQVEKDVIKIGNKMYCPERCAFVPIEVNNLILLPKTTRTYNLPLGVTYQHGYSAQCNTPSGKKHKRADTPFEAHIYWCEMKVERFDQVLSRALEYLSNGMDTRVINALEQRKNKLLMCISNKEEFVSW